MEQEQLKNTLEALLFVSAKPLKAKDFAKILEVEIAPIETALKELVAQKKDGGVILLDNNGEYELATNSRYSTQVKNFLNAELREKLTDATVEVLAIIAYRQPISKGEIEAIRGVNSQYSLRNLLMRGLIEKISNPSDARSFLYQTTPEFLMHLGLNSTKDLPEFEKLVAQIQLPQTPALNNEARDQAEIQKEKPPLGEQLVLLENPALASPAPSDEVTAKTENAEAANEASGQVDGHKSDETADEFDDEKYEDSDESDEDD